ncbi:MAG: hypothetical protein QOE95_2495, partial [Gaiellaceae bacterium]|nr:hypothetical protein [Gaiellaceae bacterium]
MTFSTGRRHYPNQCRRPESFNAEVGTLND